MTATLDSGKSASGVLVAGDRICAVSDLPGDGRGQRFDLYTQAGVSPAFVLRFVSALRGSAIRAYLNRCGHIPVELDWADGRFLDYAGEVIICSTHGARYDPLTGGCLGGRCAGRGLVPVPLDIIEEDVFLGRSWTTIMRNSTFASLPQS
jgi:nitrite reductase/ring-hydroxylating ferredoxin subunit